MGKVSPKTYYSNAFSFGIGGLYHFNKVIHVENLDLYAGFGFGFRSVAVRTEREDATLDADKISDHTRLFFLKLGARYYIIQNFGVHMELSPYKMSALNIGLSYRF